MNNNNVKPKSGSQRLCEYLLDKPLGFRFTNADLEDASKDWGFGEGVISGFTVRAKKKGMVAAVASQRGKGKRPAVVYELVSHEAWKFHGPGIGSHAGREIMGRKHDKIATPESLGNLIQQVDENLAATGEGLHSSPEPLRKEGHYPQLEHEIEYDQGSLSDQLINLAIKINELENKKPSLSGFTTDELLEELRSRVK